MQTNLINKKENQSQLDQLESDNNSLPAKEIAQSPAGSRSGSGIAKTPIGSGPERHKEIRQSTLHQIQRSSGTYVKTAAPDNNNSQIPIHTDTTQAAVDKSVQEASTKIDAEINNFWTRTVKDERDWRNTNIGKIYADDIRRHQWKMSEAYILLGQLAQTRKASLIEQAKGFKLDLDKNGSDEAAAIEKGRPMQELKKLADERNKQFNEAIADTHDQANSFSTLADEVFARLHADGSSSSTRPFSREKRSVNGGTDSELQSAIDRTAETIARTANTVAQEEFEASTHGTPNAVRSSQNSQNNDLLLKEMAANAQALSDSIDALPKNGNLLKTISEKWNVPGAMKSLSPLKLAQMSSDIADYANDVTKYNKKSNQGTLTSDDKTAFAAKTSKIVTSGLLLIPGIGEIALPFVTVANIVLDSISQTNHTPVQNAAAELANQATGSGTPIQAPELPQ
jgi:hypothetical protein